MRDPESIHLRLGGVALLAGVVASLVTAFAVYAKKKKETEQPRRPYNGWDDALGV